ncbi:MAG: TIM barrel protein [Actinomycetota bacterium]|nr:TIM barrel protein [Actinomycetota bacterium]
MALQFAANLSIIFTELPLLERPAAAAAAGFSAVESWWPFAASVPTDQELADFEEAIGEAGVSLIALNLDGGDLAAGERGIASHPGVDQRFADNLSCALGIAKRQGVRVMNALYGNAVEGMTRAVQDDLAIERLVVAAKAAEEVGARIVVETQNHLDSPRYPLRTPAEVIALCEKVRAEGAGAIGWLCDLYHVAMEQMDPTAELEAHFADIDHVQIADAPGRHEPGSGSIDFRRALGRLVELGYDGYVACEYRPSGRSEESFAWRAAFESPDSTAAPSNGQSEQGARG